jgi:hypothetical protein
MQQCLNDGCKRDRNLQNTSFHHPLLFPYFGDIKAFELASVLVYVVANLENSNEVASAW